MSRKITISTRTYENTHGRKPRGPGGWMFRFAAGPHDMGTRIVHGRTYGEAVKVARAIASGLGVAAPVTIEVQP